MLNAASWKDFITDYLGNATNWEYRITESGCSLRQVTMSKKSAVTLESGYELNRANSGGFIDETTSTCDDCAGRRPYVATFAVNNSTVMSRPPAFTSRPGAFLHDGAHRPAPSRSFHVTDDRRLQPAADGAIMSRRG